MFINKKSKFFIVFISILGLGFWNFKLINTNTLKWNNNDKTTQNDELNDQKINNSNNFIQQLFDNGGYLNEARGRNYWKNNFLTEQIYSDGKNFQQESDRTTKKWDYKIKGGDLDIKDEFHPHKKIYKYEKLKELKITGRELKGFKFDDRKKANPIQNTKNENTLQLRQLDLSNNNLNNFLSSIKENSFKIGNEHLENTTLKYLDISNNQQSHELKNSDWFLETNILSKNNKGKSLETLLMNNLGDKWENVFPAKTKSDPKLDNLKKLSIQKAGLTSYSLFEDKIATNFPKLENVTLSDNIANLTLTEKSKKLRYLSLNSNNSLEKVNFTNNLDLNILYLNVDNKNSKLLENINFSNLKKLERLSLKERNISGEIKIPNSILNVDLSKSATWKERTNMSIDFRNFDNQFKDLINFNLNNRNIKELIFTSIEQTKNFHKKFVNNKNNKFNVERIVLQNNGFEKISNFFKEITLENNNTKLTFINKNNNKDILIKHLESKIGFKSETNINLDNYFSDTKNINLDLTENKFNNLTTILFLQEQNINYDFKLEITELKLPNKNKLTNLTIDNFALKKLTNLEKNTKLTKISLKNNLLENNELILKNLKELSEIDLSVTINQNNKNSWLKIIDLTDNVKINKIVTSYDENTIDNTFKIIYGSDNLQKDRIIAALRKGNSYLDENWEDTKKNFFDDYEKEIESKNSEQNNKTLLSSTNKRKWIALIIVSSIIFILVIGIIFYHRKKQNKKLKQ